MARGSDENVNKMREIGQFGERFIVIKNADNQMRKNWPDTINFFSKWSKDKPDTSLYMVTRPELLTGWDIYDLVERTGAVRQGGSHRWVYKNGAEIRVVSDLSRLDLAWAYNLAAKRGCLLMDTGNVGWFARCGYGTHIHRGVVGRQQGCFNETRKNVH
jgi:hypothetical protein